MLTDETLAGRPGDSIMQYKAVRAEDSAIAEQGSKPKYSSLGVHEYHILFPDRSRSGVTTTAILGGRTYAAEHDSSGNTWGREVASGDYKTSSYNVMRYQTGFNTGLRTLKNFALIPWVDDSFTDIRSIEKRSDATSNLKSEVGIYWHDRPKLQYELDFALRVLDIEVHLGDVLGGIATMDSGSELIKDNSIDVSVSFTQKGG